MSKKKKHEVQNSEVKVINNKKMDSNELKIILPILALGLLLRLIYIFETNNSPFYLNLFSDSKIYFDWAKQIATSRNWIGEEVFFMSPGYPYLLASIFSFFGASVLAIRIIQVLISTATIFLIFLSAKNLFGKTPGYISAWVASIYSIFIFYSGSILGETIQVFLISYLCYLFSKNKKTIEQYPWFKIGFVLGLAALFRANILFFAVVLVAFLSFSFFNKKLLIEHFRKIILIFLGGVLIPVIIVTFRNYMVGDDFVIISSNGGINFFIGNNENSPGVYLTPKGFDLFKDMPGEKFAEKITRQNLSSSEASNYWFDKGFKFILANPGGSLILFSKKMLLFFNDDENPQSTITDIGFFRDNYSTLLKLPLPGFLFILIFATVGIFFSFKNKVRVQFLLLLFISIFLSTVIFFVIGRFRLAATPILLIFTGFGLSQLITNIKEKKYLELIKPAIIIILVVVIQLVLIPKFNYSSYDAWSNLADVYFKNKQYDEAIINAQKSLALKKTDFGFVLLANSYAAKGNTEEALENYHNALKINSENTLAYFNLALFLTQQGNFDAALVNYNQTIKIDPSFAEAYRNMAIINYMIENYDEALSLFKKYLSLISDEQIKATVQQDINEIKSRLVEKNQNMNMDKR